MKSRAYIFAFFVGRHVAENRLVETSWSEKGRVNEVWSTGHPSAWASHRARGRVIAPRSSEDVNALQPLRTVHLRQHLVDDSIRDPGAVMSSTGCMVSHDLEKPFEHAHRFGAMESNSSKNRMHGRAALARSKSSRTDASLAPMYLFSSSGPFTPTKLSPHSFATAEARRVFPHPG
jgi:hypothetical protein